MGLKAKIHKHIGRLNISFRNKEMHFRNLIDAHLLKSILYHDIQHALAKISRMDGDMGDPSFSFFLIKDQCPHQGIVLKTQKYFFILNGFL